MVTFWVVIRFVFLGTLGFIFHNKGGNQNVGLIGSLKTCCQNKVSPNLCRRNADSRRPEQRLAAGLNYARIFGIVHRRD